MPSGRTFTLGEYPHSAFAGMSGVQGRVRNSNVMLSSQVRLTFAAITEAQMLSILLHYQGQQGTFKSFTLPSATWSGVNDATDYQLTGYGWRYIEPPTVSDAMCADAYDVELTLETVPPEGTAIAGLDLLVIARLAAGVGVALSQTDLVVTATLTPGVAGVPGIDASVSWTLAAGSPAGGATASGLNAMALAFIYSESFANGLTETVNAIFTPGVGSGTSGGDPDSANVSLLLHMDGSNGSTTFTDDSGNALTVVANGNAQISTAESKFGGASCLLDGNGDYLSVASSSLFDFGSGVSFTAECFINPTTLTRGAIISQRISAVYAPFEIVKYDSSQLQWLIGNASVSNWEDIAISSNVLTVNTWHHIALVGDGTNLKLYCDGTQVLSTSQPSWTSANRPLYIGAGGDNAMTGYIDDLRITKGVARYTANFTPPTAPFPDP